MYASEPLEQLTCNRFFIGKRIIGSTDNELLEINYYVL